MSKGPITVSIEGARRLTVTKQHLAGEVPSKPDRDDILSLIRDIGYIQWDPITIVAPSHHISLWSRLGSFRPDDLEKLLWEERKVFEHWTPIASIVLTEDYPLYLTLMRGYPESLSHSWANHIPRAKRFMATHGDLRRRVLKDLKGRSLTLSQFSGYERKGRSTDGWSSGNDVSNMLFHLLMAGEVMVVGHEGNQNVWGLTGEFLPRWANKERLTMKVFEREAAQRAIRALGTAAPSEINYYFVRGRYQTLKQTLAELEEDSLIHQVRVQGFERKEVRYIHDRDLPLLESLRGDGWMPRTTLIAAFDNLIAGRQRANTVFGFDYVHEQFLPKSKRRYGTYVLPILHGERLVGRIDPRYDKEKEVLVINSVHAEPGAPEGKEVSGAIRETIGDLAEFIGAREVEFAGKVPENWRKSLR